jgi:hypothetical protein
MKPKNPTSGYSHRKHRPKKNRNGKYILGNQMFGKKHGTIKEKLERIKLNEFTSNKS